MISVRVSLGIAGVMLMLLGTIWQPSLFLVLVTIGGAFVVFLLHRQERMQARARERSTNTGEAAR